MADKVIFLDRDGVINRDPGEKLYVTAPKDFEFLPGVLEALKRLRENGFKVVVISNQAGVSKGLFTKEALDEVNSYMLEEAEKYGARIEGVFYCTHRNEDNCECRKPKPGLIKKAVDELNLSPDGAYLIGDSRGDIEAGRAFGLKAALVLSGKAKLNDVDCWPVKPDLIKTDLLDAVNWIIKRYS